MPIENLYIARVTDALILVEAHESHGDAAQNDKMQLFKSQAKQILKKLNGRSTARMSIETNPYIFHYIIENGVCYLALADKAYPKRLAFLFLEEISKDFENELRRDHGDNWQRHVETVARQYAFITFDNIIQKKRREYRDPASSANVRKLTEDLQTIQTVMRKTIDDVLDRGNKLDDVAEISKSLSDESKRYKWSAKKLSFMALVKQWSVAIALLLVVIIILYIRFW
jgi:vesicle transport protein SEC22